MWSPSWKKPVPPAVGEVQEAPIPRIAEAIIKQAIRESAAEIRLVPHEAGQRVEYLKDGSWVETMSIPNHLAGPLTEHFEEMAGLPLGYRMALQGLIPMRHGAAVDVVAESPASAFTAPPRPGERDYDVHLFITPTRQGEKIVMRIEAADGPAGEARG